MNQSWNPQLGVFCCDHVLSRERPILLVTHESDGDWQFVCGGLDHDDSDDGDSYHYLHVGHLVEWDSVIEAVADLPAGWEAERQNPGAEWIRTRIVAPEN